MSTAEAVTYDCRFCAWTHTGEETAAVEQARVHALVHPGGPHGREETSAHDLLRVRLCDFALCDREAEGNGRCLVHAQDVAAEAPALNNGKRSDGRIERGQGPSEVWTPNRIIAAIRAYHLQHGEPPTDNGWDRVTDTTPSSDTLRRKFGSFSAALKAAGFDPRPVGGQSGNTRARSSGNPWSADEAIEAVRKFAAEHDRPPGYADLTSFNGLPSNPTLKKLFGMDKTAHEIIKEILAGPDARLPDPPPHTEVEKREDPQPEALVEPEPSAPEPDIDWRAHPDLEHYWRNELGLEPDDTICLSDAVLAFESAITGAENAMRAVRAARACVQELSVPLVARANDVLTGEYDA